jgi:hypothetical protein
VWMGKEGEGVRTKPCSELTKRRRLASNRKAFRSKFKHANHSLNERFSTLSLDRRFTLTSRCIQIGSRFGTDDLGISKTWYSALTAGIVVSAWSISTRLDMSRDMVYIRGWWWRGGGREDVVW